MRNVKKIALAVGALAALALGAGFVASATGGGDGEQGDHQDKVITGNTATRAGQAATRELGGGIVRSVEQTDEDAPARYEVKVDKAGKVYEVQVSSDFAVTAQTLDDEESESGAEDAGDQQGENEGQHENADGDAR